MENLAEIVSKMDVINALEKIIKENPTLIKSTKYNLKYKDDFFPPKEVIRLAAIEKGLKKEDLSKYRLHGGPNTNDSLERMGFEIVKFADWANRPKKVENRIARLCWNDNGWIMPSGRFGKSIDEALFEGKFGYGHEEWLLDVSKVINGYHYGFLEPVRQQHNSYEGNIYNVWLYTINKETKIRYWIGEIKNLKVISVKEAEEIKNEYAKLGWLKEMENEIELVSASSKEFSKFKSVNTFNIKFRPFDLKSVDYFEIPNDNPIYKQARYVFTHFVDEFGVNEDNEEDTFGFDFDDDEGAEEESPVTVKRKKHFREPKSIEITFLHKAMSEALTIKLKEDFGNKNVRAEHSAGFGGNRIDIVVKDKDNFMFYEIKAYTSLKTSIREAIGQLMEYSLWTNKKKAKKLIVITQPLNDFNKAKTYFKHLRETYNLPFYYQSFDFNTNTLSKMV